MLIYGGQHINSYNDLKSAFITYYDERVEMMILVKAKDLPFAVTPESPSYSLNSHANFYFMDNMSRVYKF